MSDRRIDTSTPDAPVAAIKKAPPIPLRRDWPDWVKYEYDRLTKNANDATSEASFLRKQVRDLEGTVNTMHQQNRERREAQYQASTALELYGDKSDLTEVKSRVALHPKFSGIGDAGAAAVVQVAQVMGMNPFMHLHAWLDGRGRLNITPDYKGLLFLAGEDNIMIDGERSCLLGRDEMLERGITEADIDSGAIGAVCYVIEMDKAAKCKEFDIDYHPATGYAVWYPKQTKLKKDGSTYVVTNDPPNGRDGAWVAEKNALRAALYKVADFSLKPIEGAEMVDDGWEMELPPDTVTIDGEVIPGEAHFWVHSEARKEIWIAAKALGKNKTEIAAALGWEMDDPEDSAQWQPFMNEYAGVFAVLDMIEYVAHERDNQE